MSKTVLVAYLERKKKINIEKKPTESEYQQLREEAVKIFGIDKRVNSRQLIFQRFDPEWDDYIDVDEGDVFAHKGKLKLVINGLSGDVPSTPSSYLSCKIRCLDAEKVTEVEVDI